MRGGYRVRCELENVRWLQNTTHYSDIFKCCSWQIQAEDDTATDIDVDSDYSYEAESEEEGENIDYDSCDEEQASTSSVKPTNEYGDPLDYDHVKADM